MRLLVGLGLQGPCLGALRFASWLADHGEDKLHGVHVLHRSELFGLAQRALADLVQRAASTTRFGALDVVEHDDVASGLTEACDAHGADALIIGRKPADDTTFVRLGHVARNVLQMLPGPVAVVPAEFSADHAGTGPVIAATDLGDDSVEACRYAYDLAKRLGRALLLVHVASAPRSWGLLTLSPERLTELEREIQAEATARMDAWCRHHALDGIPTDVRTGEVADALLRIGMQRQPPLMVLGSRRLGLLARMFTASVGAELAATVPWPTLVVPPLPHPSRT